jgi:hypothetical protein
VNVNGRVPRFNARSCSSVKPRATGISSVVLSCELLRPALAGVPYDEDDELDAVLVDEEVTVADDENGDSPGAFGSDVNNGVLDDTGDAIGNNCARFCDARVDTNNDRHDDIKDDAISLTL